MPRAFSEKAASNYSSVISPSLPCAPPPALAHSTPIVPFSCLTVSNKRSRSSIGRIGLHTGHVPANQLDRFVHRVLPATRNEDVSAFINEQLRTGQRHPTSRTGAAESSTPTPSPPPPPSPPSSSTTPSPQHRHRPPFRSGTDQPATPPGTAAPTQADTPTTTPHNPLHSLSVATTARTQRSAYVHWRRHVALRIHRHLSLRTTGLSLHSFND